MLRVILAHAKIWTDLCFSMDSLCAIDNIKIKANFIPETLPMSNHFSW